MEKKQNKTTPDKQQPKNSQHKTNTEQELASVFQWPHSFDDEMLLTWDIVCKKFFKPYSTDTCTLKEVKIWRSYNTPNWF